MRIMAWNCRGLNDQCSPALPYLVWLARVKRPSFLFFSETKMSFVDVSVKLGFLNSSSYFGVDADGSKGGLFILS